VSDSLAEHHRQVLKRSAISDEVIEVRGYRTVTEATELERLGFAPGQCRVPGLLLPLHTTDGRQAIFVFRPDNPRVIEEKNRGKNADGTYPCRVIKYEYPKGAAMHVDCPPACQPLLADPKVRLWITEGQKKADALASQGECAIALLGVWNFKGRNASGGTTILADFDYIAFEQRQVCIVFDSDMATKPQVHQAMDRLRYHLRNRKARVSIVHLPAALDGAKQGVDDFLAAGHTLDNLLALAEEPRLDGDAPGAHRPPPSPTTLLVKFGLEAQLFHTADESSYASVVVNDHIETLPLRNHKFKQWLARRFYAEEGRVPGAQAMQDALNLLEAHCVFDGPTCPVFLRVADWDGALWLDLADEQWRAVRITPNDWTVVEHPPVKFRRARGMLPLPNPARGARLGELKGFLNVGTEEDWIATASWLHAAARPEGPYPILVLHGSHGSAKSSFSAVLRAIIDPNVASLKAEPRELRDLIITAMNGWVLALDNLSSLPIWLSDALCRLATGGGFATRQLYTDDDEMLFDVQRPVILNGIEEIATRGDLLDRALILDLPFIDDTRRRPEKSFWQEFEQAKPHILGALLDIMVSAQNELPSVKLTHLPRMADFAVTSVAAARALGWSGDDFLQVYSGNRSVGHDLTLDCSPIAPLVRRLVENDRWVGTSTELITKLNDMADERTRKEPGFPKNARSLSNTLRRLAPTFRAVGISIRFEREGKERRRTVILESAGNLASAPSTASAVPESSVTAGELADANGSVRTQTVTERTQNGPEQEQTTQADAKDAQNPALSAGSEEIVEWSA
jgi:hypothetical protein